MNFNFNYNFFSCEKDQGIRTARSYFSYKVVFFFLWKKIKEYGLYVLIFSTKS